MPARERAMTRSRAGNIHEGFMKHVLNVGGDSTKDTSILYSRNMINIFNFKMALADWEAAS